MFLHVNEVNNSFLIDVIFLFPPEVWGENIIHTHTKTSNSATYFFALEIILNLLSVCQIYFSIHLLVNLLV